MYEHFEPSSRIFVDREEYLEWMDKALRRCKDKAVVLHLRGIGGIGKSSLLEKWSSTIDETVRLDCDQHLEFWNRLDIISRGVVRLGVSLRRFDILWHIRKRFVEGVEPATETGRDWAKDVLAAIPFVGSIAAIGTAISSIGKKVAPKLRERYGDVGSWLQNRLGKDYLSRLLEILWKDPRHAEFLYLDAMSEDLKERKTTERPILFLLDHFEDVDSEKQRWRYGGKKISEAELWYVFLCSLKNCVGVLASRFEAPKSVEKEVENNELIELDRESCIELLELRGAGSSELQNRIISVSGGNPFVIDAICDIMDTGVLSSTDIENLRAGTLEEVRLKTWRRLFSRAEGLHDFINRAGLMPFFNRNLLSNIAPTLTADYWDRIIRLSFVRLRDDETYVLHDLAKDLVITELGDRLASLVGEVVELLLAAHEVKSDYSLLGHAISVQFLADEERAINWLFEQLDLLTYYSKVEKITEVLNSVRLESEKGRIVYHHLQGFMYTIFDRIAEAEHEYKESIALAKEFAGDNLDELGGFVMLPIYGLGKLHTHSWRLKDAEEVLDEGIQISKVFIGRPNSMNFEEGVQWIIYWQHGIVMMAQYRLNEAEESQRLALDNAIEFAQKMIDEPEVPEELILQRQGYVEVIKNFLAIVLLLLGKPDEAERLLRENIETASTHSTSKDARGGLAETLRMTNRIIEAEEYYRQLVEEAREFRKMNPSFPQPISVQINNHNCSLVMLNEFEKAEESYKESLADIRAFVEKTPEYYTMLLVWTLLDYAVLLRRLGRYEEADVMSAEALEHSRKIVAATPEGSSYKASIILNNRGIILRCLNRIEDAEQSYNEAIDRIRDDVQKHPEAVTLSDLLSASLSNLGVLLRKGNRLEEAEKKVRESFEIKKELAKISPNMFSYELSIVKGNLGILLAETNRLEEAHDLLEDVVEVRRGLVELSPEAYSTSLASSLNNLGILLKRENKDEESWLAFQEGLEIAEKFHAKAPSVYEELLGTIVSNMISLAEEYEKWQEYSLNLNKLLADFGDKGLDIVETWLEEEQEIHDPIGP